MSVRIEHWPVTEPLFVAKSAQISVTHLWPAPDAKSVLCILLTPLCTFFGGVKVGEAKFANIVIGKVCNIPFEQAWNAEAGKHKKSKKKYFWCEKVSKVYFFSCISAEFSTFTPLKPTSQWCHLYCRIAQVLGNPKI